MNTLTVFTPSFNRAYCLPRLYDSLVKQSSHDFEWIIVDDGSTDNTQEIIKGWIHEKQFLIRYFKQENAGKMCAHNFGVSMSESELFVCVDSDDYLPYDSVQTIIQIWRTSIPSDNICGIVGYKSIIDNDKTPVLRCRFPLQGISSLHSLYDNGFKGDTTLVFRTEIIKQFPFPVIEGEKFITEATAYNIIDLHYKYLLLDKALTICEYMEDGYTTNAISLKFKYPKGWALYYNQLSKYYSKSLKNKICNVTYYILFSKKGQCKHVYKNSNRKGILFFIGWLLSFSYERKYNKLYSK